jgi:general stress protein CsbA
MASHQTATERRDVARRSKDRQQAAFWPWRIPTWLLLAVLGLSLYLLTLPADLRNNADTVDRFFVTRSLVHNGVAWVTCPAPGSPPPADSRLALGRHGCYYAIYGPGQSVAMIPLYIIGKVIAVISGSPDDFTIAVAVRALDPLLGALVLALFFLLARQIGYTQRIAIILTLILAFASTLWSDVQSGQEHIQITLALLLAVYCAISLQKAQNLNHQVLEMRNWALACGAASGLGFFTRYDFIIVLPLFIGYLGWLAWQQDGRPLTLTERPHELPWPLRAIPPKYERARWIVTIVGAYLLGFLPFLLVIAGFNIWRYGAPWRVGESAAAQLGYPIWQGIPNLLVSPGKGLVWYLPLLWLLPLAVKAYWRRTPHLAWLSAALVIAYTLFYANVVYWHGDPAWGPRYLFPVVPLLVLPLGELLAGWQDRRLSMRCAIVAVLLLSLAVQLAAVSVDPWRFWYHLIDDRQRTGQTFVWGPQNYRYYWDTNHIPLIDQFRAVANVASIATGDHTSFIPESPQCHTLHQAPLAGVTCRPLNTISPIWLNDRYQWLVPLPVPLSLAARAVIVGLLGLIALAAAGLLWLQTRLRVSSTGVTPR